MFDQDGVFLYSFGKRGTKIGELKNPAGLAFDSRNRLFVSESGNKRVQVFSIDGRPLGILGGLGREEKLFKDPCDLDIDKDDRLYVVDKGEHCVKIFHILSWMNR